MRTLGEKVKEQRAALGMSQKDLASKSGIAERTIGGYETGVRTPRAAQLYKLARALEVSTDYLKYDSIDDPNFGIERMDYVEEVRRRYGVKNATDLDSILKANQAVFAGGNISLDDKQAFYDAITEAYIECKKAASAKFGRKN